MSTPQHTLDAAIERAARAINGAEFLLFCAGAGMGVDSGLPDFRGNEGFWKAYPPLKEMGLSFEKMANPRWFVDDPELAWGFYGHRLNLYRRTTPHAGFGILKTWSELKQTWVYTSNVDGHFQKAGFTDVCEVHGSINFLQCTVPCSDAIWPTGDLQVEYDEATFKAKGELPTCPQCSALARPNILFFSDRAWNSHQSDRQENDLWRWLRSIDISRLTIVEIGAGLAVSTVRRYSEHWQREGATLVRINLRDSQGPSGTISLECGGLEGLRAIEERRLSLATE